jgi:hypothetical protein
MLGLIDAPQPRIASDVLIDDEGLASVLGPDG